MGCLSLFRIGIKFKGSAIKDRKKKNRLLKKLCKFLKKRSIDNPTQKAKSEEESIYYWLENQVNNLNLKLIMKEISIKFRKHKFYGIELGEEDSFQILIYKNGKEVEKVEEIIIKTNKKKYKLKPSGYAYYNGGINMQPKEILSNMNDIFDLFEIID